MERKKRAKMAKFEQEVQMTHDPDLGYVPYDRLLVAKEYVTKLIDRNKKQRDAIPGITWANQGPDNVGGRTRAIMFDPNDGTNKRVFAGAVSGGLWKNEDITDAMSPWTKINDFLDNLTVTSIVSDPQDPMTFYAGTGEAYSQVTPGIGLFKSTDGGATWNLVPNTGDYKYITEVLVRIESGTSVIYLGSKRAYVGPNLENNTPMMEQYYYGTSGLFRSANDGMSWTQVIPLNDDMTVPTVDDIGLTEDNTLWATTGANPDEHYGGDIYKCASGDCDAAGKFVKKYDASANGYNTVARTVMALAPGDSTRIYAVAANNSGKMDIEYFVKSVDAGTNWTTLTIPLNTEPSYPDDCTVKLDQHFTNGQGTYDLCMTVHPSDADLVLLGGIDVYRTLDGFTNTSHVGSWVAGPAPCDKVIHADHHAFVFRPGNPTHVAFGNDGGVFFSTDAGNAAQAAPNFAHHVKNYNVSQLYSADISPTAGAGEYIGGLQDNGTQNWNLGNTSTTEANGGDGAFSHIDQDEPNIQVSAYVHNDYGITFDDWVSGFVQVTPVTMSGRFINPTDYDDMNNILYTTSGTDRLGRVTGIVDAMTTPTLQDSIIVGGDGLAGKMATTIRVDPNTPTTIYVGNDEGYVFKISNANTGSIKSTDISAGLPFGWVSSIDVEVGYSMHLFATMSNFGVASVWETTNGGTSWASVEGNLPDIPVRWGIFSPLNSDQALLATDMGIWSTTDLNSAGTTDWDISSAGLANVRVDMLQWRISDSTVVAATFGRGLYTAKLGVANPCPPSLTVTDNPAIGLYAAANTVSSNPGVPIQVTTNATFQAGSSISLNNLFEVVTGAIFEAKIAGCP